MLTVRSEIGPYHRLITALALLACVACLCKNQARYQPGPAGLMAGTASTTRISVEIFVEQYQILPVRI